MSQYDFLAMIVFTPFSTAVPPKNQVAAKPRHIHSREQHVVEEALGVGDMDGRGAPRYKVMVNFRGAGVAELSRNE